MRSWLLGFVVVAILAATVQALTGINFGTARLYVVGGILVVGAVAWLLTRDARAAAKRREREQQAPADYAASMEASRLSGGYDSPNPAAAPRAPIVGSRAGLIVNGRASVYAAPDPSSAVLGTPEPDTAVTVTGPIQGGMSNFYKVSLPDGVQGFVQDWRVSTDWGLSDFSPEPRAVAPMLPRCSACGADASIAVRYCTVCGKPLAPDPAGRPGNQGATAPRSRASGRSKRRRLVLAIGLILLLGLGVYGYQQVLATQQQLENTYAAAVASADQQQWDAAVNGFQSVVRLQRDYRDAQARLTDAQEQLSLQQAYAGAMDRYRAADWPAAVDALQLLEQQQPTGYKDVTARLADAQRQLGFQQQYEAARGQIAAKNFATGIPAMEAVAATDYSGADAARQQAQAAHRAYAVDLVAQASRDTDSENWTAVAGEARQALNEDPSARQGETYLGGALERLHRYDEAETALGRAIAQDPTDSIAFDYLGWTYLNGRRDPVTAEANFRQALKFDPRLANALAGLGQVQLSQGAIESARASFQQALAISPSEAAADQGLGDLELKGKNYSAAEDWLRKAVALRPKSPAFLLDLATILEAEGDYRGAHEALIQADQVSPDDPDVAWARGLYYIDVADFSQALSNFDSAIGLRGEIADYHYARGWALIDLRRYAEAFDEGATVIQLGDAADGYTLEAAADYLNGQPTQARTLVRQALDADPNNTDAQELLQRLSN